jgi:hypothetical protein
MKQYLYLARRDKRGLKLVTILKGESFVNAPLTDLKELNLPPVWQREIEKIIWNNRMLYEPRIETAESFQELQGRLKHRGYTRLPSGPVMMLNLTGEAPKADISSCPVRRIMIQKGD